MLGCGDDGTDPCVVPHGLCPNTCTFKDKSFIIFNLFLSNLSKQISLMLFILTHFLSQFLVQANWLVAGGPLSVIK